MATGPVGDAGSVPADRDALAERCAAAEQQVRELTAALAAAQDRIAELEQADGSPMSIFDSDTGSAPGLAGDGSDPRVLSVILAATAVVSGMVALLALLNDNLNTTFGFAMVLLTVVLAWAAVRTRVEEVVVEVSSGVVYIQQGETSYRFDLRKEQTQVDMLGRPGDSSWQVRFHRRGMDDFVVDGTMVDAHDFVSRLREVRPEL